MFLRNVQTDLYALNLSEEGYFVKTKLMLIHSKQVGASPNGPEGGPSEKRSAVLVQELQQTRNKLAARRNRVSGQQKPVGAGRKDGPMG
jgi:hypothetical protein